MTPGEEIRAAHRRHVDMWDTWARADSAREDASIILMPESKDWAAVNGANFPGQHPPMAVVEAW